MVTDRCFSQVPLVSSTNKTDCHDITEILLKMALNNIKQTNKTICPCIKLPASKQQQKENPVNKTFFSMLIITDYINNLPLCPLSTASLFSQ